jgi:SAM-dependent methyltransferase
MFYKTIRGRKSPITFRNKINFVVRWCELFGLKSAIRHYGGRALGIAPKNGSPAPALPVHSTERDQHFGFESDADSTGKVQGASAKWGSLYERSSENVFRNVMGKLPLALENYIFIDLGAGKGFALCLAAEFPFKKAIGVEYSQPLVAAAAENLRTYDGQSRKCKDVTCIFGDATDFKFPPGPTVVYLYNSFQGKVMDRVIRNLRTSLREHPRDLWILYTSPWEHRKFKRSREFELVDLTWEYAVYHHRPAA